MTQKGVQKHLVADGGDRAWATTDMPAKLHAQKSRVTGKRSKSQRGPLKIGSFLHGHEEGGLTEMTAPYNLDV